MLRVAESICRIDQPHVRRDVAGIQPLIAALVGWPPQRTTSSGTRAAATVASRNSRSAPWMMLPDCGPTRAQARGRVCEHRPFERGRERVHGVAQHRIPAIGAEDQHAPLDAAHFLREPVEIGKRVFTILQCGWPRPRDIDTRDRSLDRRRQQRLAERQVEVHRSRRRASRLEYGAPTERARIGRRNAALRRTRRFFTPAREAGVQRALLHRLRGAPRPQLWRPIRGQHDQRNS